MGVCGIANGAAGRRKEKRAKMREEKRQAALTKKLTSNRQRRVRKTA